MAQTDIVAQPSGIERFKNFARSRDGWTLLLAIAISVVSSIFMAGILPVEDEMSAFGVLFIYFVTMIIIAGLIRMARGLYDKIFKRGA